MTATVPNQCVRPAVRRDLASTARLHLQCLPEGFFARLGPRFLRHYHRSFADSPVAEVFVVGGSAGPHGMLVGTFDNAAHYRWALRRRGPALLLAGVVALLARPRLAVEFARTRAGRYSRALLRALRPGRRRTATPASGATTDHEDEAAAPVAVLTHVAVSPTARGSGAGKELVETFVRQARRRGAREVRLITRRGGSAASFYRALGWHSHGARRASDGTLVEEFVHRL